MLSLSQITPLAESIFARHLPAGALVNLTVRSEPDTSGEAAIFVNIELKDEDLQAARRERIDIMVDLRSALVSEGEDRFPFVDMTSPSDREEAAREDAA